MTLTQDLQPEQIGAHGGGYDGYTALARCIVLRAIHDYKIGIKRGYIEHGRVTDKLKVALEKQRRARRMSDVSVAIFRLESNTAAEDYVSAVEFITGNALNTMLDLAWKEVNPEYIREKLDKDDRSRMEMRNDERGMW